MSGTRRWVFIGLVGGVLVVGVAVTAVHTLYIRPAALLFRDEENMVDIGRNLNYAAFLKDANGQIVFPDQLSLSLDLPAQTWECPFCGERYVYRPVNLAGIRITRDYSGPRHFVMWCPREHPDGRRVFMLCDAVLGPRVWADSQVSWYHQKMAEDLSAEEREQENRYRAEQGLPLLE